MTSLRKALSELGDIRSGGAHEVPRNRSQVVDRKAVEAQVVEGHTFKTVPVAEAASSGFTHFLDGAQKVIGGLFLGMSPISLVHSSAGVCERVDGEVLSPSDYAAVLQLVLPNSPMVADNEQRWREALRQVSDDLFREPIAVEVTRVNPPVYGEYEDAVEKAISQLRDTLEGEVVRSRASNGWLLVDGGLGRIDTRDGHYVGVVKSHGIRYFASPERERVMLDLRAGQRTTAFLRPRAELQGAEAYSFYLRLHDEGADPLFGVMRVELPAHGEYLERIDEIAAWLLHERAPLSKPDMRFDRMLYPIRLVEQHLKARQPSTSAMIGVLAQP